ncbi:MAG: hypothetical protein ABSG76_16935 [Xanthobacteraceae bacterium]|jgi:hypothetical protein
MQYRVYSGPRGTEAVSALDRDRLLYKEYPTLDEAFGWARHVEDRGGVVMLIEGDDGTRLSKLDVANALRHGDADQRVARAR